MTENLQLLLSFSPPNTADKLLGKKLALRLARVDRLLSTLEKLESYQEEQPNQSVNGLWEVVRQIINCSQSCTDKYIEFEQVAQVRKSLYVEGQDSLKGAATMLWHNFIKEFPAPTLRHQIVQVIWNRLYNQRAFAPPTHIFSPKGVIDLRQYRQSYQSLSESFQLLLTVVQAIGFQPTTAITPFDTLWLRFKTVDDQVEEALAQLTAAHQERLRLYEELSDRTEAIVNQIKQLYGPSHPAYRRVRYCKV